jgi:hypothetical protein
VSNEVVPLTALGAAVWLAVTLASGTLAPQAAAVVTERAAASRYDATLSGGASPLGARFAGINDSLKSRLNALAGSMGRADDVSAVLEKLMAWARKADIRFVRVQPQEQVEADGVVSYPVLLEFSCAYAELGRFMADLEAQPQSVRVTRVAVSARSGHACEVRLLVTMFLRSAGGGS